MARPLASSLAQQAVAPEATAAVAGALVRSLLAPLLLRLLVQVLLLVPLGKARQATPSTTRTMMQRRKAAVALLRVRAVAALHAAAAA